MFGTLYYQGTRDVVNRVNRVYADTVLSRIFTNAGRARRFGLEAGLDLKPTAWWTLYLGGNVYNYRITGTLFDNAVLVNNGRLVYSLSSNQTFQLPRALSLQWTVNYLSTRPTAQGEDSPFYTLNTSLRKSLLKGRLTAMLQWQNMDLGLLGSQQQRITTRGADFFTTNYIYETDIFLLNLSFNLNQRSRKAKFTESEFGDKEF